MQNKVLTLDVRCTDLDVRNGSDKLSIQGEGIFAMIREASSRNHRLRDRLRRFSLNPVEHLLCL